METVLDDPVHRIEHSEAAGILTHRSDRRDQSGGYGEASGGSSGRC